MIKNNNLKVLHLKDENATKQFGKELAQLVAPPLVLTFSGDLGSGKTTLIREIIKGLGIKSAIKSPTFSLVESYDCKGIQIHHFDLYRIGHSEELEYLGFRDYFTNQSICCIEWPEKAGTVLSAVDLCFKLSVEGAGRALQIIAPSVAGLKLLTQLAGDS